MSRDPATRLAAELSRRGLGAPARLLADAHRPLAPLLCDLGAALSPLLGAAAGRPGRDLGALLEDPDGLHRLIVRLDQVGDRPTEDRSTEDRSTEERDAEPG